MKRRYYVLAFAVAWLLTVGCGGKSDPGETAAGDEETIAETAEADETPFEYEPKYTDYAPDDLLVAKNGVKRAENLLAFECGALHICTTDGAKAASFLIRGADPVFSPDGTKIAFSGYVEGLARLGVPGFAGAGNKPGRSESDCYDTHSDIFVMNVDGSNVTRLTFAEGNDYEPAFSPDGAEIAFVSERGGKSDIFVMNADGSEQRRLTPPSFDDGGPAFSPDGRKIVFDSNRDGDREVFVINADGSELTQLTSNDFFDYAPCFFPDGSRIVYGSILPQEGVGIRVMNADGSSPRTVTAPGVCTFAPTASPDGSWIAFPSEPPEMDYCYIRLIRPDGSDFHKVGEDIYGDRVSFSPMRVDGVLLDTYGRVIEE
ncbi:MAG: PD40 domain-containing protein [Candidatus Coatesbacteria bacterium]|nr:MAG: PD40 domain-containing protein [Candidatus Coatesbacteria bacterium]